MGFFRSHGNSVFRWNYIPEESISREFLLESKCKFKPIDNTEISFLKYEDYLSMLSKSTKQNLRTAENRLKRGNKTFKLLSNLCQPLPDEILHGSTNKKKESYGEFCNKKCVEYQRVIDALKIFANEQGFVVE